MKIAVLSSITLTENFMMITINISQFQIIEKAQLAKAKNSNLRISHVFHNKEANLKTFSRTLVPDNVIQQQNIRFLQMMNIFIIKRVGVYPMM